MISTHEGNTLLKLIDQRIEAATAPLKERIAELEQQVDAIEERVPVGMWEKMARGIRKGFANAE